MKRLLSKLLRLRSASSAVLLLIIVAAGFTHAKAQTTTFAQFSQTIATNDFTFTNNTTSATLGTIPGGVPITFSYSNIVGLDPSLQGPQAATLTITNGLTNQAGFTAGGIDFQRFNQFITIVINRNTPAPVGGGTRTNLLTAVFQPNTDTPSLLGLSGGNSASISPTTPGNLVVFSSHFLSFGVTTARNIGLTFSSVNPIYALGAGGFLQTFNAAGTGTFASNPVPTVSGGSTAADVTIGGRVLDPKGRGLANAEVILIQTNGSMRTVRTSSFGNFQFDQLDGGQSVVISVRSRRFNYQPQVVSLSDNAFDLSFTPAQ